MRQSGFRKLGAALFGAALLIGSAGGDGAAVLAQDGASQGMPVEAATVEVRTMADEVLVVGSLRANESVMIRPEIAGRIAEISFEEGGRAEAGQVLVRLDDASRAAEVRQAEANLDLARRNFSRADELYRQQNLAASARDEALARLRVAEAALELARVNLQKTELRAPFAGLLGLRHVSLGDYVSVGDPIVSLEDVDPIKVDFRVPEVFAHRLQTGQTIRISVDAVPGEVFEGSVYAIDPQIDEEGRSVLLRARVPNADGPLRPGMFARVTLVLDVRPAAPVIPEEALIPQGTDHLVYKIVEGKVVPQPVTLGQRRRGVVEITSGLSAGDQVITAGQIKVQPGQPVTVVPSGEAEAGGGGQQADAAAAEG